MLPTSVKKIDAHSNEQSDKHSDEREAGKAVDECKKSDAQSYKKSEERAAVKPTNECKKSDVQSNE